MHKRWFQNALCCKFDSNESLENSFELESKLKNGRHKPLLPTQKKARGFSPVYGYLSPEMLCEQVQEFIFISILEETKKVNPSKLANRLNEKLMAHSEDTQTPVNNIPKEVKDDFREVIETELLKKAESKEKYLNFFLDTKNNLLIADVSSFSDIESIVSTMQKFVCSKFEARPFIEGDLTIYFTSWVNQKDYKRPVEIELNDQATLIAENSSKAVLTAQDLEHNEVFTLIDNGKVVTEIAVCFKQLVMFKINKSGDLKGIKPTDLCKEGADRPDDDSDIKEAYQCDWIIMANEVIGIFAWLERACKVNSEPEQITHHSTSKAYVPTTETDNGIDDTALSEELAAQLSMD